MTFETTLRSPETVAAHTTLFRLLDEELAFSPSYLTHYSSHLAMALVALYQLGAPSAVLTSVFDAHARGESEPRDDTDVLETRRHEVARDGIASTVAHRVPALVAGPGSQLFHPLIRLAYALELGHPGQVAAALLDWERRHHTLPLPTGSVPLPTGSVPQPTARPGGRRLADVADELAGHPAGTWPHTFDLDRIARRPEFGAAIAGLAHDERTLDDLSAFAIAAHTGADDFITLHLVTGARAVRIVSAWLDHETAARLAAHTADTMAVAYAAVGAPPPLTPAELDRHRHGLLPSRRQIADRAIANRDPHVIKLANVALAEEERTGDPLYRYNAARVVGLVD